VTPESPALLRRLRALPSSRRERLGEAWALAEDPARLVSELLETVDAMRAAVPAGTDPGGCESAAARVVLSRELDEVRHRERAARTPDVAFWLERERRLAVAGDADLDGDYVDHELTVSRTVVPPDVPAAAERSARPARSRVAVRIDLLLASAHDRRPIVAEVKIAGDGDPYAGLVQALAGLACLATPARYAELRARYPAAAFPPGTGPPPMDAYVLGVDTDWGAPRRRPVLDAVKEITRGISADPRSLPVIRRAVVLQVRRDLACEWSHAERQ
jgi:hypothetical protein